MSVKEIVQSLCEEKGIKISFLEKELGISNGTIGKWTTSKPSISNAKKVADYFGVSVEYILGIKTSGIYDRIKEVCREKNITISKLERELGLSGAVSKWNKHKPTHENLSKVSKYLDVSIEYLVGETEEMQKSSSNEEDRLKIIYNLLVDLGYVQPGEQVSGEKLEILSSTIDNFVKLLNK